VSKNKNKIKKNKNKMGREFYYQAVYKPTYPLAVEFSQSCEWLLFNLPSTLNPLQSESESIS
jgi:hypothetical protein